MMRFQADLITEDNMSKLENCTGQDQLPSYASEAESTRKQSVLDELDDMLLGREVEVSSSSEGNPVEDLLIDNF